MSINRPIISNAEIFWGYICPCDLVFPDPVGYFGHIEVCRPNGLRQLPDVLTCDMTAFECCPHCGILTPTIDRLMAHMNNVCDRIDDRRRASNDGESRYYCADPNCVDSWLRPIELVDHYRIDRHRNA